MKARVHPTKAKLTDTVVALLDEHPAESLQVDQVLQASGVSKGSLYHHFEDFGHLIESALIKRFAAYVDSGVLAFQRVLDGATTGAEFRMGMRALTDETQRATNAPNRFERARILALSEHNARMRTALGSEQQRLTEAFEDFMSEAQRRGWIRPDVSPRAAAVMIQAYTLGRLIDDVTAVPIDERLWISFVNDLAECVLGPDGA